MPDNGAVACTDLLVVVTCTRASRNNRCDAQLRQDESAANNVPNLPEPSQAPSCRPGKVHTCTLGLSWQSTSSARPAASATSEATRPPAKGAPVLAAPSVRSPAAWQSAVVRVQPAAGRTIGVHRQRVPPGRQAFQHALDSRGRAVQLHEAYYTNNSALPPRWSLELRDSGQGLAQRALIQAKRGRQRGVKA